MVPAIISIANHANQPASAKSIRDVQAVVLHVIIRGPKAVESQGLVRHLRSGAEAAWRLA